MKNLNSKRRYLIVVIVLDSVETFTMHLNEIIENSEQFEFLNCINERIDEVLDLKECEYINMQMNRDDKSTIGTIKRIK